VAALGQAVVVDQLGIGLLGPAARGLEEFVGEGADGGRDVDAEGLEERQLVLPIEPR
jgi:hypothetical protein